MRKTVVIMTPMSSRIPVWSAWEPSKQEFRNNSHVEQDYDDLDSNEQ